MKLRCQVLVSKYLKTRGLAPVGVLVFVLSGEHLLSKTRLV